MCIVLSARAAVTMLTCFYKLSSGHIVGIICLWNLVMSTSAGPSALGGPADEGPGDPSCPCSADLGSGWSTS